MAAGVAVAILVAGLVTSETPIVALWFVFATEVYGTLLWLTLTVARFILWGVQLLVTRRQRPARPIA
jgi:hypothetical protein